MPHIRELVQQSLKTGYLSIAAEEQLRQLLQKKYELDDLDAFIKLQLATMSGQVKQESRELIGFKVCSKIVSTAGWMSEVA